MIVFLLYFSIYKILAFSAYIHTAVYFSGV